MSERFNGCLKHEHQFKTILSCEDDFDGGSAVRWCVLCGAIRVDFVYDGRTMRKGNLSIPMSFSEIREGT